MKVSLPLPEEKKLTVVYRVEAGCLGPKGLDHIEGFCGFAQKQVESVDSEFVHWQVIPRYDKNLPEMQYQIGGKTLSQKKAATYLHLFGENLNAFEDRLNRAISLHIDTYLGR